MRYIFLLVLCLQIWSVLNFLVSVPLHKSVESIYEVKTAIRLICYPTNVVIMNGLQRGRTGLACEPLLELILFAFWKLCLCRNKSLNLWAEKSTHKFDCGRHSESYEWDSKILPWDRTCMYQVVNRSSL